MEMSHRCHILNDLVRLAVSVKLVRDCQQLNIKLKSACEAILEGYMDCLKRGGHPIVLAEHEENLERLGMEAIDPPRDFWKKLQTLPTVKGTLPTDLKRTLEKTLPAGLKYRVTRRKAGMGSRGQQRFVAIGRMARRVHRARSKSDGSLCLLLVSRRYAERTILLSGDHFEGYSFT
jgi:uncharacterized protein (DUF2252 family)